MTDAPDTSADVAAGISGPRDRRTVRQPRSRVR